MERVQQSAEVTVIGAVGAGQEPGAAITRERSGRRPIVGDPTAFIVNLERELGRMRRYGDSSCLLMIAADARVDIPELDRLGLRFAASLRSYDSLCRYGASHFLVLLPHVQSPDVAGIVRRLRVQVAGYSLRLADGREGFVTASTGGTMLDTDCGMHDNIDRAVLAYQAARALGGNDHRMWSQGLETE